MMKSVAKKFRVWLKGSENDYTEETPRAFSERQRKCNRLLVLEDSNAIFEAFQRRRSVHAQSLKSRTKSGTKKDLSSSITGPVNFAERIIVASLMVILLISFPVSLLVVFFSYPTAAYILLMLYIALAPVLLLLLTVLTFPLSHSIGRKLIPQLLTSIEVVGSTGPVARDIYLIPTSGRDHAEALYLESILIGFSIFKYMSVCFMAIIAFYSIEGWFAGVLGISSFLISESVLLAGLILLKPYAETSLSDGIMMYFQCKWETSGISSPTLKVIVFLKAHLLDYIKVIISPVIIHSLVILIIMFNSEDLSIIGQAYEIEWALIWVLLFAVSSRGAVHIRRKLQISRMKKFFSEADELKKKRDFDLLKSLENAKHPA